MGSFMSGTIRIPIQALAVGNLWKYEQLREEEGVNKSAPDLDNWVWLCYWHTFAPEACEKKARLLLLQRKTLRRLIDAIVFPLDEDNPYSDPGSSGWVPFDPGEDEE
jgi:hypothetical protein